MLSLDPASVLVPWLWAKYGPWYPAYAPDMGLSDPITGLYPNSLCVGYPLPNGRILGVWKSRVRCQKRFVAPLNHLEDPLPIKEKL